MTQPVPDAAVRTAGPADAPDLARVQLAAWRADLDRALPADVLTDLDPQTFADFWQASLSDPPGPRHRALVATEAGEVVGLSAVAPDPQEPGAGELLALSVDPPRRRRGHGSRLLNAAVDTLAVNDIEQLHAWVLLADEPTRAFLEAAGMGPDGAWRDRVVSGDGATAREVRLTAAIGGR